MLSLATWQQDEEGNPGKTSLVSSTGAESGVWAVDHSRDPICGSQGSGGQGAGWGSVLPCEVTKPNPILPSAGRGRDWGESS